MEDIIEEALDESDKKRTAAGEVEGRPLRLVKESYETSSKSIKWKLEVFVSDDQIPSSKDTDLSGRKAEKRFWNLVDKYGLSTVKREDEYSGDSQKNNIISGLKCRECDSEKIKQVSGVMRTPGSTDSCKGRCMSCGEKQDFPVEET